MEHASAALADFHRLGFTHGDATADNVLVDLEFILDAYAGEDVARVLATSFTSVWRRSLALHLLQARLSFQCFCELGRLLRAGSRNGR
jgi:hypothetical protein